MNKIDMETWSRKDIFEHYSSIQTPFYMVTFKLDVTKVYNYVKKNNLSFYYAMIYLCTKAINEVDAFRMIIKENEVYTIEKRDPSFTDLKKGSDAFYIVTMACKGTIDEFCQIAKNKSVNSTQFLDHDLETNELIYFSCLPWIRLTAITNERDYTDPNARDDVVPRISWGKYEEVNGRKELGLSLDVNHRLIDGYHIGLFASKLDELINQL